jgi:hypothetical protein
MQMQHNVRGGRTNHAAHAHAHARPPAPALAAAAAAHCPAPALAAPAAPAPAAPAAPTPALLMGTPALNCLMVDIARQVQLSVLECFVLQAQSRSS